jgi:3-phosphoshikimate 1-carboxyvinyltransferase
VIEPEPTRDHTELMLRYFGVDVRVVQTPQGRAATVIGQPEVEGRDIRVPADPSSAAFPMVAALIRAGSDIRLENVGINPHRIGLIETLIEMGADITLENRCEQAGEPIADIRVRAGRLKGVTVPASRAPSMIDEYPILAMAAAFAEGPTRMEGLAELRVKESDRLAAIARGLKACGVEVEAGEDYLVVNGGKAAPRGDAEIEAELDHRIAMSFLVLGMGTHEPIAIDDGSPIDTSFPGFAALMNALGAKIRGA